MMWSRSRVAVGVVAVAGLVVAGCSGSADGSAHPASATGRATSGGQQPESSVSDGPGISDGDLPKNGAPDVEDPLDASMLKGDPCAAMSDEQAEQFPGNFTGTRMRKGSGVCEWIYENDIFETGGIGGKLDLDNRQGLSSYYGYSGDAEVIPVDPVGGYPAVHFDLGRTDEGACALEVGIRNDLIYTAQPVLNSEHPSYDEPCEVAREFAEIVVGNLKEAQ